MNPNMIVALLGSLGVPSGEGGGQNLGAMLAGAAEGALKLGLAVKDAALSLYDFTLTTATGLDNLYALSQRTGASVEGIESIGYGISQVGGNVDEARGSLENLSRFVQQAPGAEHFLNQLDIQVRDASGHPRDTAVIFTEVGQKLSAMPLPLASQNAKTLGIRDDTLAAMRGGAGNFSAQHSVMAKTIGFDADEAATDANRFMTSLREVSVVVDMVQEKIGSRLAGGMAGWLDTLSHFILDNYPRIEQALLGIVDGIVALGDTLIPLFLGILESALDLAEWWGALDGQTQDLITLLGGLALALGGLNSAFLLSPIGLILALAAAIALLWDDYKKWAEGGQSFINWGEWQPVIDNAIALISDFKTAISSLVHAVAGLLNIDLGTWSLKWDFSNAIAQLGEFNKMLNMLAELLKAVGENRWSDAVDIGKSLFKQGNDKPDALPGVTKSANEFADWMKEHWHVDPRNVGKYLKNPFWGDTVNVLHPENNQSIYSRDFIERERATTVATNVAGPQLDQHNSYYIYGNNAQQIGAEVELHQNAANTQFMRVNQVKVG
ncbi:lytic transglycosylase [Pseudescherichia vulneris]|uniref:lytic transglycosylase n=1 Tax=Pseudescherichia vulneris TaxID=566 RepID=UPI0028A74F01|nr:lytic transglycosylase [Pseudescherichia vulneris]